jgi:DNA-binding GntR family transcriptional regulator
MADSADWGAQSLFCHRELVAALAAGRPALAEAVMRMHILGAREFLVEVTGREQPGA